MIATDELYTSLSYALMNGGGGGLPAAAQPTKAKAAPAKAADDDDLDLFGDDDDEDAGPTKEELMAAKKAKVTLHLFFLCAYTHLMGACHPMNKIAHHHPFPPISSSIGRRRQGRLRRQEGRTGTQDLPLARRARGEALGG